MRYCTEHGIRIPLLSFFKQIQTADKTKLYSFIKLFLLFLCLPSYMKSQVFSINSPHFSILLSVFLIL